MCFFFQAEDGIRDLTVTGVQTCALPISVSRGKSIFFTTNHGAGSWTNRAASNTSASNFYIALSTRWAKEIPVLSKSSYRQGWTELSSRRGTPKGSLRSSMPRRRRVYGSFAFQPTLPKVVDRVSFASSHG